MSNKKVMSLAIKPEMHDEAKKIAKRKGLSTSAWIGTLVEQALKISPDEDAMVIGKPMDEDILPVILKIPVALKNNPDQLQKWLTVQTTGILKAMTKKVTPDADSSP
jgi:hypothetical protein